MDPIAALEDLKIHRPVFHSEADFQHALAWELQRRAPEAKLRLESKPFQGTGKEYLDIRFSGLEDDILIELKYKTRAANLAWKDEEYRLENHGAQPISRALFWHDVERLERFVHKTGSRGVAIFLTNEQSYWTFPKRAGSFDEAFRTFDGRHVTGSLAWHPEAGATMRTQGKGDANLRGEYALTWRNYSRVGEETFRYLALRVSP